MNLLAQGLIPFLLVAAADVPDRAIADLKAKDAAARVKAATALAKFKGDPKAARALCGAAMDKSPQVRTAALIALEEVAPKLQPAVAKLATAKRPPDRIGGLYAIAALKGEGAPAVAAIAVHVADCCTGNGRPSKFVNDGFPEATALAAVGSKDPEAIAILVDLTKIRPAAQARVRESAVRALAGVAKAEKSSRAAVARALVPATADPDKSVRIFAIRGFANCRDEAKPLIPELKKMLAGMTQEKDLPVRASVREAIAEIEK